MGVISTPPRPARANCSSCRVTLVASTALPGHHHRVHGRASGSTTGAEGEAEKEGVLAGGGAENEVTGNGNKTTSVATSKGVRAMAGWKS